LTLIVCKITGIDIATDILKMIFYLGRMLVFSTLNSPTATKQTGCSSIEN